MKKNLFSGMLISLSVLAGCTIDSYDKGEGKYSQMTGELVDAYTDGGARLVYATMDDGKRLTFAQPAAVKWMTTADSVYRAAIYYKVDESGATLISAGKVGVLRPQVIKRMKTDPVGLESVWMAAAASYLNLSLNLKTGAVDDDKIHQTVGCHRDTLLIHPDGSKTLCLTLYHDQSQVPEYYTQRNYFSIPLRSGESDSVRLTIHTYDGVVVKTIAKPL